MAIMATGRVITYSLSREAAIKNKNIFIADTVILETEWVLRFAYKFKQ
jgi:predicted nucleic-acid-binding protein